MTPLLDPMIIPNYFKSMFDKKLIDVVITLIYLSEI